MTNEHPFNIVLAIYPNTYGFGFALFENPQRPLYCDHKRVQPIGNSACLNRIRHILTIYEPTLVIIPKHAATGSSRNRISRLIDSIKREARKRKLGMKCYTPQQIADVFTNFDAKNIYQRARVICDWFPEYENRLPHKRKFTESFNYNMGVFNAMCLAMTHFYLTV